MSAARIDITLNFHDIVAEGRLKHILATPCSNSNCPCSKEQDVDDAPALFALLHRWGLHRVLKVDKDTSAAPALRRILKLAPSLDTEPACWMRMWGQDYLRRSVGGHVEEVVSANKAPCVQLSPATSKLG